MNRKQVTQGSLAEAERLVRLNMETQLRLKGYGTFASRHEILGSVTEEYHELVDAVHRNDMFDCEKELADVAVAAIFGLACIKEKSLDW